MHHPAVPAIRLNNTVAGRTSRSRIDAQYSKHSLPRGGFAHRKKCKARNVLVPVVYALLCAPHSAGPLLCALIAMQKKISACADGRLDFAFVDIEVRVH